MIIAWWLLLVFGLTYLITAAAITQRPRHFLYALLGPRWGGWLACAPCTSFWVGIALGVWEPVLLAYVLPGAWQTSSMTVALTGRVLGGVLAMGAVSAYQFAVRVAIAEIDPNERGE
jgi:hypothetical protein